MLSPALKRATTGLIWLLIGGLITIPVLLAALSPLQASRNMAYVIGGLAGIIALALLIAQPLLAVGFLPAVTTVKQRVWHQRTGIVVVVAVLMHIGGLYITSPDDMTDALLLVAPTLYSVYGVIALWALIIVATLVALRRRLGLKTATWNILHNSLAVIIVVASVVHALMIEGAMGFPSKLALCVALLLATTAVVVHVRILRPLKHRRSRSLRHR